MTLDVCMAPLADVRGIDLQAADQLENIERAVAGLTTA
jgi:hypothetical protein